MTDPSPKHEPAVGVLNLDYFEQRFIFKRFSPSPRLETFLDSFWTIQWKLDEHEAHTQEVVPHPCVQLSFLKDDSAITGVPDQIFAHTLRGEGHLIGVKFRPAGFYPFSERAGVRLKDMVNQRFKVEDFFDVQTSRIEKEILSSTKAEEQIGIIERAFFSDLPPVESKLEEVNKLVYQIESDTTLTSVSQICEQFDIGERKLQRLFSKYLGVSPKWVINRYRLQRVLEKIENGESIKWAEIANELGYYDQTHFVKDVKKFFGKKPSELAQKVLDRN